MCFLIPVDWSLFYDIIRKDYGVDCFLDNKAIHPSPSTNQIPHFLTGAKKHCKAGMFLVVKRSVPGVVSNFLPQQILVSNVSRLEISDHSPSMNDHRLNSMYELNQVIYLLSSGWEGKKVCKANSDEGSICLAPDLERWQKACYSLS
jgi:hypothetical protein